MMQTHFKAVLVAACTLGAYPANAQRANSLDLTVDNVGISIGDSRRVVGLRLNYRDRNLREATGINATIWIPYEESRGDVRGLALGLPATGGRRIDGIALGIVGIGVHDHMRGIAVGGVGMGVGNDLTGLGVGGIGLGIGRDTHGIVVGGIGAGIGGDMTGLAVGGLGIGAGGDAKGILIGGLGAGVGRNLTGVSVAGVGIGAGNDVKGLTVTGVGLGAGSDVTGVQLAGIGIGAGRSLKWVSIAGIGVGAPQIRGVAIASAVGGEDVRGLVIAPIYFRIANYGTMRGVNVSAFNNVQGTQRGLAIGILNIARSLDGVQLGLLNYAGNKRSAKLLPIVNYARGGR